MIFLIRLSIDILYLDTKLITNNNIISFLTFLIYIVVFLNYLKKFTAKNNVQNKMITTSFRLC